MPLPPKSSDDWSPFTSRTGFELVEILYTSASLSNSTINGLLDLWTAILVPHDNTTPFANHEDLHSTINTIKLDGVPWQSYTAQYNSAHPDNGPIPDTGGRPLFTWQAH